LMILEMLFTFIAVIPVYFLNGVATPEWFFPVLDLFFIWLSFLISLLIGKIPLLVTLTGLNNVKWHPELSV
jgi:hypothetical protein